MRAEFGGKVRQKGFFRASRPQWGTWRKMYFEIARESGRSFGFSAFRHWCKGERLAPTEVIDCITSRLATTPSKPYRMVMRETWGQRKGGIIKNRLHGCNLTRRERRIGGLRGRESLVGKYGSRFDQYWRHISSRGGLRTLITKKNLMRKSQGPKGEPMFNELEADTAAVLCAARVDYEYEPRIVVGDKLVVPDFLVGNLVIECTKWMNAREKASSLLVKFGLISAKMPSSHFLVVTTPSLKKRYAQNLGHIQVATVRELGKLLGLSHFVDSGQAYIRRGLHLTTTAVSSRDEEEGFEDIVAELDREEARVKVRMEMRRFRKPTTVIEGLKMSERDLQELGTKMKKQLATGGSVKDGVVLLQGDHRERVVEILVGQGFSESSIEVI